MKQPPGPLSVTTLSAAVYDSLKALLLNGHFRPGQWIRERELTELLGVSRTPVREALRLLEQERLVDSLPRRGFRMRIPRRKELQDFYELRGELEGLAAELASERAQAASLEAIGHGLREAREAMARDQLDLLIAHNNAFHDRVSEAAGNRVLQLSLGQLRDGVNLYRTLSWSNPESRAPITLDQHEGVYRAIEARDGRRARERARAHVWDSLPLALEALRSLDVPDD